MDSDTDFMHRPAIDIHGHCGTYPGYTPHQAELCDAGPDEVSRRAAACGITITVVSEIGAFDASEDRPSDVDAANDRAARGAEQHDNLRFYAVVNPKLDGWESRTDGLLAHPRCAGVKLHPRWNFWDVDEHGDRLFGFLNERRLLTLTHTGDPGNEPEKFIPWANRFPGVRLILAHIGHHHGERWDLQIRAVEMSTEENVWADTSSSNSVRGKLIEIALDRIGADRILFGTDTPLYFAAMQKARVAYAPIPDEAKRKILYDNAAALLGL